MVTDTGPRGQILQVRAMAEPDPEPTAAWAAGGTVWPETGAAPGTPRRAKWSAG